MNTISQTITTLAASKPAANTPQICEIRVTTRMNRSILSPLPLPRSHDDRQARPAGPSRSAAALFDRKRLVDQLLSVGDFSSELLIGTVLGDFDPGVVFLRRQRDHVDIVLLEDRDHFVVEAFRGLVEVVFRLLSAGDERVLLLLVKLV